ncbi:hypothetical protein, partial [Moorena producens]|uniref:hypothetical protein n=1 Tax=Moorena producens TaxID=1155739 RepID=UPI001376053E
PDSRLPRCAFRRRIKFATGRTAPDSRLPFPSWEGLGVGSDSLGALSVGELNSPRVAPLPTPDSLIL